MAIQYAGGTNVNTTFAGDTRTLIVDNIRTHLLTAGWSSVSGASGDWIVRSALTLGGLQVDVRLHTTGGTPAHAIFQRTGVSMTDLILVPSRDLHLKPAASKTFRIIANRYQFFVLVPGSSNVQDFICGGVPFLESFQTDYVAWAHSNSQIDDTDLGVLRSFRTVCGLRGVGIGSENAWQVAGGSHLRAGISDMRAQGLVVPSGSVVPGDSENTGRVWHNDEAFKIPARICFGVASIDDAVERGQLWDAVVVTQEYALDLNPIVFDGKNWYNITKHGVHGPQYGTPSLLLVIP